MWLYFLNFIVIVTAIINFPVNKYFIGWDALNPEFNVPLNVIRAIFPFWQNNYGLGTLTGHGFAATLPHTLIIGLLSIVLPQWSLRSFFTFLCFYSGGIGMYFLVSYVLRRIGRDMVWLSQLISPIAFISSLFYLFNLGTIQVFYIQLEAFIAQFATLPWLFLAVFLALDKGKTKHYLLLFLISLFSSIQGFIPSLYIAYFTMLLITLCGFAFSHRTKDSLARTLKVLFTTLAANLYWLLPVAYFQLTHGAGFLEAYNNLSSTPHFIELSKQYGNLANVALLKSYLFSSFELGGYILQPYITHLASSVVPIIGYGIFALICFGLVASVIRFKNYYTLTLAASFLYLFSSLAIDTFPFNLLTKFLQTISPTYEQAFRTTFTKFGIGMSFLYSIEFAFALFMIAYFIGKIGKKISFYAIFTVIAFALIYYSWPSLSGNLLYKKLQVKIPPAYFDLMDHMNSDSEGRIADLPQYCTSGWYAYNWGYFGSGFMWYGVKQPFLSRSFDVWSNNNENYYWELSQDLNSKNYKKAAEVLNKYHVSWVLYDPNIISCTSPKNILVNKDFVSYLTSSSNFSVEKIFSKGVYSPILLLRNNAMADTNYFSLEKDLPNIGPSSQWLDSDEAAAPYITTSKETYQTYLPFRSLLTKRGPQNGSNPAISVQNNEGTVTTELPKIGTYQLQSNNYVSTEKMLPIKISLQKNADTTTNIFLQPLFPIVTLNGKVLSYQAQKLLIGIISADVERTLSLYVNGQIIKPTNNNYSTMFSTNSVNTIQITNGESLLYSWESSDNVYQNEISAYVKAQPSTINNGGRLTVTFPVITDNEYFGINQTNIASIVPVPCNEITPTNRNVFEVNSEPDKQFVRLISQNSSQCIKLSSPHIFDNQGYVMSVLSANISGNLPRTSLYNNGNLIYSDLTTGKKGSLTQTAYIIPPSSESEVGYDFEFLNSSHTNGVSKNDFYGFSLYPIPYNYLKSLRLIPNAPEFKQHQAYPVNTEQMLPNHYSVSPQAGGTLTFAQSFDKGWKAYLLPQKNPSWIQRMLPFIYGKELKNHVLLNNWANGWNIQDNLASNSNVVVVYVPQYLEFGGFLLLILALLSFLTHSFWMKVNTGVLKVNNFFENKAQFFKSLIELRFSKT